MLVWLQVDRDKSDLVRRVAMLCGFGFFQGCCLGPLIDLAIYVDPAILGTAMVGTITVFVCFSLSALIAKRRSYLYLGAMLGSAISFMFYASLANIFFRSNMIQNMQIYGGLMVFCGYIVFDTQIIVEVSRNI
jgi:FtsH-binding integral membrane protein